MVLPKRKTALVVLLGAALAALLVDRFVLGWLPAGPGKAAASAPVQVKGAGDLAESVIAEGSVDEILSSPRFALANRLDELAQIHDWEAQDVRDAFCPSQAWFANGFLGAKPANSAEVRAREFAEKHKLTATAVSAHGRSAIINGQCIAIGQSLAGFRLVAVERNWADLTAEGVSVRLQLAGGGSAGEGR
jgi:hypothetical protein